MKSSDSNVAGADVLTGAQPGNYKVDVSQLAGSQTLVSNSQPSVTTAIGSGAPTTITFNFGTIGGKAADKKDSSDDSDSDDADADNADAGKVDDAGHYGAGTTFSPTAGTSKTLKIDSSNNTLGGIRDAINNAGMGVTASIVNDGSSSPYRLVLTNNVTGAAQAMQITAKGDSAVSALLQFDPSNTDAQAMSQTTLAQDAKLSVNGIALSSPSNKVASALNGFTLHLSQTGTTTLAVSSDTSGIESNINDFVDAYNTLAKSLASLTNYDSTNPANNGPLLGDATTTNIKNALQRTVTSALDGSSGLSTLADVGITFSNDGSLSVDDNKLKSSLANHLSGFASLFATNGTSSDSGVNFLIAGDKTQAGKYPVDIARAASQGSARGVQAADLDKASEKTLELTVALDGATQNISVPRADYATPQALADAVQKAINANSTFTTNGSSVNVSADDQGRLNLTSTSFGGASQVNVSGTGAVALLGRSSVKGVPGQDVQGTIGGMQATGHGQTLTGQSGTPVAGMALQITGPATGLRGNISYSVGFGARMDRYITDVTGQGGMLDTATHALNTRVSGIEKQITNFQAHLTQVQSDYQSQFSRLNNLSVKMKTASNLLDAQFNRTSSR